MAERAETDPTLPSATPTTAPFWNALRQHRVMIQRCDACSAWIFYPRSHCPACLSPDPSWHEVAGSGTIHSFTVARQPTSPLFEGRPPIVLAIVELDKDRT